MQDRAWAALLSYIPPDRHDGLMLVTRGGTEIALQTILRIDQQFLAIKGRLAGSQDTGRVFFIAYTEIDYFGFQKSVREEEFHELFGGLRMPTADAAPVVPEAVPVPPVPVEATAPPAAPPTPDAPPQPALGPSVAALTVLDSASETVTLNGTPGRGTPPIRSTVLERFRSRNGV